MMNDDYQCSHCGEMTKVTFSDYLIVVNECHNCFRQLHIQHNPRCSEHRKPKLVAKPRHLKLIEGGKD